MQSNFKFFFISLPNIFFKLRDNKGQIIRKRVKEFYFILVLSISLFACKKDNTDNITQNANATVYDVHSRMPVPGVKVYLHHCLSPGILLGGNWGEINSFPPYYPYDRDSTITNNQGYFNFQFTPILFNGHYTTPRYHIDDSSIFRVFSTNIDLCDDSSKDSIFVDTKKYLTIEMQKIVPVNPFDSIWQHIRFLPEYNFGITAQAITGIPRVRKFYYSYPSINKVIVEWIDFHSNPHIAKKDSFDLLPNGTNVVVYY